MSSTVKVSTSDDRHFEIERKIADKSVLLKNMLEDVGESGHEIPLPNVTGAVFEKVLEWCEHHKDDAPEPEDDEAARKVRKSDDISEWDRKFMDVDQETIFHIVLAANYLDIKALLDLGCKTIANMIKGKTPEKIREIFGLENDFTPEEEEKIRQENAWAENL